MSLNFLCTSAARTLSCRPWMRVTFISFTESLTSLSAVSSPSCALAAAPFLSSCSFFILLSSWKHARLRCSNFWQWSFTMASTLSSSSSLPSFHFSMVASMWSSRSWTFRSSPRWKCASSCCEPKAPAQQGAEELAEQWRQPAPCQGHWFSSCSASSHATRPHGGNGRCCPGSKVHVLVPTWRSPSELAHATCPLLLLLGARLLAASFGVLLPIPCPAALAAERLAQSPE
mmetsp:Transcript_47058/g.106815  ORF Transcript_47058/g.106815 Transcript_47058/m.106815 type:complete len:230 (+) Transcript_47058:145-834(+)